MGTECVGIRAHILEAAEALIRTEGLLACTTRAIALQAGCSEGSIYRHFADKDTLICEIVQARFPVFGDVMRSLSERVGSASVQANLESVARAALGFFRTVLPLVAASIGDHELLVQFRRHFQETDTGPVRMFGHLTRYLAGEAALGRIGAGVSPEHVTRLLLGACFSQAFVEGFIGDEARLGPDEEFVTAVVGSLMSGLLPVAAG